MTIAWIIVGGFVAVALAFVLLSGRRSRGRIVDDARLNRRDDAFRMRYTSASAYLPNRLPTKDPNRH